jgi:hypothetical protein
MPEISTSKLCLKLSKATGGQFLGLPQRFAISSSRESINLGPGRLK